MNGPLSARPTQCTGHSVHGPLGARPCGAVFAVGGSCLLVLFGRTW